MKESYHRLFTKIKLYFSPLQVNHTPIKYFLNVYNQNSYSKDYSYSKDSYSVFGRKKTEIKAFQNIAVQRLAS